MNRVQFIILLIFCSAIGLKGQLWEPLSIGTSAPIQDFYCDTLEGKLYIAGKFKYAGDSLVHGLAVWDGNDFESVGGGLPDTSYCLPLPLYICSNPMRIYRFKGEVFVSGSFHTTGGISPFGNMGRWNGQEWASCGYSAHPLGFSEANGELFACGIIQDGSNGPTQAFGRWNGAEFERFGKQITFRSLGFGPYLVEYYKGEYYFGGNFDEPGGLNEIMRWDGSDWRPLQSGVLGDAAVMGMKVFKDQLFVGGPFYQADGNPADGLMAWDGEAWYNPFPDVQFVSQVNKMQVIGGSLYIVGRYYVATKQGWEGPYGIARYDGKDFCAFGGLHIYPWDVAGFGDQVFVTANYTIVNPGGIGWPGDTVNHLGRWIGGDSTDICVHQPVRVEEPASTLPAASLHPNPARDHFSLMLPAQAGACKLRVLDMAGREVVAPRGYTGGEVDVASLPAGVYLVEVTQRDLREVLKLVRE